MEFVCWIAIGLILLLCQAQSSNGSSYDTSTTVFSPDGELLQVSYAEVAAGKSSPIVCYTTEEGDILLCSSPEECDLRLDQRFTSRVHKVDDNIWFAGCGNLADSSAVLRKARNFCSQFRDQYGCPPSVAVLAMHIGESQHKITLDGSERPLAVFSLLFGFDEITPNKPQLYLTRPSGLVSKWKAIAVGANADSMMAKLEEQLRSPMKRDRLGVSAIGAINAANVSPGGKLDAFFVSKSVDRSSEPTTCTVTSLDIAADNNEEAGDKLQGWIADVINKALK